MAQHEEIIVWLDRRWKEAIEHHLKDETLLSYIALYRNNWQAQNYVACCGTAFAPVEQMLRTYPQIRQVYLCLDSVDYIEHFRTILSQQAELKAKRVELEQQQAEDAELTSHMELAADTLEQAGTAITEWNERNIRDLVASVRILSKEEILVRLRSGIEVKQHLV